MAVWAIAASASLLHYGISVLCQVQEVFGRSFGSYTDFLSCSGERGLFKLDLVLKCYYALDWPVKCVSASTSSL